MRVLVWATTIGAIVGSAHAPGAAASPFNPTRFAEQLPDNTFELVALASGASQREVERGFESWISAAFLSPADYETLSRMAGFYENDPVAPRSAPAHAAVRPDAVAEPARSAPVDLEWNEVDLLPSPAVLAEMAVLERRSFVGDEDGLQAPAPPGSLVLRGSIGPAGAIGMAIDGYEDR
jgi:hypothetical protein